MKGCFKFYTFIFWISPNLVKYTYRLLSLEQHHKIERKQGVCHTMALPLTLKSILSQKKNYGNSNILPCKNIIFKQSSKRIQNPTKYYDSVTNLKFQQRLNIVFQKSSYKNRPITEGPESIKLLYSIMNLKHNILALVGKANKALLTIHPSCCTGVCRFNLVEFGYLWSLYLQENYRPHMRLNRGKKGAPRRAWACNLLDSHKLEKWNVHRILWALS